ncbi:hypothetical protein DARTUKUTA_41 [Bacillus phage vB_BspP_Dartukuta]|nr:hypothetical protein DARTUKUTA_41 [Bacillus phage vB_BspP_Dartukuta]
MSINNELNQSNDGDLTPDQLNRLLAGEDYEGDTEAQATETGGQPEASSGDDEGEPKNEAELSADNAVVMARDNKHTIPFEKLEEAREGQKHWRAQAEAAQQELEALKAQAQARADAGIAPTRTDELVEQAAEAIEQGADISLFGDFSEEDLSSGIDKKFDQKSAPLLERIAQLEATLKQTLGPIQEKQAVEASNAHYDAIRAAHPDADSVVQSQELAEWIDSQPTFVRGSMNAVIQKGSTDEVIELFSAFKSATGTTQAAGNHTAEAVRSAAKQKIANVKSDVPASLSDFPAGRAGAGSRSEAMQEMAGIELLDAMDSMTPQQIEDFLNRTV